MEGLVEMKKEDIFTALFVIAIVLALWIVLKG